MEFFYNIGPWSHRMNVNPRNNDGPRANWARVAVTPWTAIWMAVRRAVACPPNTIWIAFEIKKYICITSRFFAIKQILFYSGSIDQHIKDTSAEKQLS